MKKRFSTELAYALGIVLIACGVMLMEKADFGVSMVVAPAYLLYRWLSPVWGFVTFGMAEYCFQAFLLAVLALVIRRFRISFLFAFVTAVIYGFVLDGAMALGTLLPAGTLWLRAVWYVLGMLLCSAGVSAMFHTYIAPEVYELFVKEVAARFRWDLHRVKTVYDCASCLAGIVMSFLIFGLGRFEGVRWGTVLCALVNGRIIGWFSAFCERRWTFYDRFALRRYFERDAAPDRRP